MADDALATPSSATEAAAISMETHNHVKEQMEKLMRENAVLKAKNESHDAQKRETLTGMKPEVNEFIKSIVGDAAHEPYKHELAPMTRWAEAMDQAEAVETNLSIGRLISCASANYKRTREEASQMSEKSAVLAATAKERDEAVADRDSKASRIAELEGLLEERTEFGKKMQDELARHGLVQEKMDFSKRSARENVADVTAAVTAVTSNASAGKAPLRGSVPNMDDALLGFLSAGPANGGARITPSSTGHSILGQSNQSADVGIAAAIASSSGSSSFY
jgi:hypothetical protein